jgi:hypothetical protein
MSGADLAHEEGQVGETQTLPGADPSLSPEEQQRVAALAGQIAGTESSTQAGEELLDADEQLENLPAMSFDEEAAMAVDMIADMAVAYDPAIAQFWPDKTKRKCAVALGKVLKKYNFSLFRSPEIVLVFVMGPPLWNTSKAIAQIMNEKADAAAVSPAPGTQA